MEIKDFFHLSSRLLLSTVKVHAIGLEYNASGLDDEWSLIKGKYEGIKFPVYFRKECGKNLTDILNTGWPGFLLISDRLKTILEKNHLTGWKTFPIKIYDKNEREIKGYYGFSVTGICGPISYKNSEIVEKRYIKNGPTCRYYKGLSIGLEKWDGSDFFTPNESFMTIVTKKAADTLKNNNVSNLELENLTLIETPENVVNRHERII